MTTEVVPDTLARTYDFTLTANDGLTLEGYAAVFNTPTRISNWEGNFTEQIAPGAFARAVRANPRPVVQFDHGQHPLLGSIPIAALSSMREDERGLFVSARLHDNWLTEPVRDAIKSGAINGMSFRFQVPEGGDTWDTFRENRTLTDVNVLELGPVVFPAYAGTEVNVRSKQLAEALEDETVRHDLAIALLGIADTPDEDARADEPPAEDVEEVRVDPAAMAETETPDADQPEGLSAPNPARLHVTSMEVRLARARARSNLDTRNIFDG